MREFLMKPFVALIAGSIFGLALISAYGLIEYRGVLLECEAKLPGDQHCVLFISAVPEKTFAK